jgi:hypothetical protein
VALLGVLDPDPQAAKDATLTLHLRHRDAPIMGRGGHVGTAVGLDVDAVYGTGEGAASPLSVRACDTRSRAGTRPGGRVGFLTPGDGDLNAERSPRLAGTS